jgi:hypothetical protein
VIASGCVVHDSRALLARGEDSPAVVALHHRSTRITWVLSDHPPTGSVLITPGAAQGDEASQVAPMPTVKLSPASVAARGAPSSPPRP